MSTEPRPTVDDCWHHNDGRVMIRPTHPHPAAGPLEPPIGFVWEAPDGGFVWAEWEDRNTPRSEWATTDTRHQATEELLTEHLTRWQHEHDRALEWDTYNRQWTVDGRRTA